MLEQGTPLPPLESVCTFYSEVPGDLEGLLKHQSASECAAQQPPEHQNQMPPANPSFVPASNTSFVPVRRLLLSPNAVVLPSAHAHPNRPMPADRAEAPSIPQGEAAVPAAGPLAEPKEGWWLEASGGSHTLAEEAALAVLSPVDSGMDCYRKHFLGHGENGFPLLHTLVGGRSGV